jgi:hypothetical protein
VIALLYGLYQIWTPLVWVAGGCLLAAEGVLLAREFDRKTKGKNAG